MKRKYFMIAVMAAALGMTACSSQKTETEAATATTAASSAAETTTAEASSEEEEAETENFYGIVKDSRGYGYYSNRRCRNRSRI